MSAPVVATPITVTAVCPASRAPAWVRNLVSGLCGEPGMHVQLVVVEDADASKKRGMSVPELCARFEARFFRHKIGSGDPSESIVDLRATLNSLHPEGKDFVSLDDLETDSAVGTSDFIVWLLHGRPPRSLIDRARQHVLTLGQAFSSSYGFREFAAGECVTRCDVVSAGHSPADDRCLATSFAATDSVVFSRGMNAVRAKCQALLLAVIRRAQAGAETDIDGNVKETVPDESRPGILVMAFGMLRIYSRYAMSIVSRRFRFDQWQIGYRLGGDRLDTDGLRQLAPRHAGFWADPFVAKVDGRRCILFEEYLEETGRGHLSAIDVFDDGTTGEPVNIMMSEHHLSYPFVLERDGELFMIPECAESGRVDAYRCTGFPDRWERHATLLHGIRAFDPTLVFHDDRWWMFVTLQHDGNSSCDELHLYYADDPFGPWTPHALNPVRLDIRCARPAGALFRKDGRLFRPAQDCSKRYGWAISIQEVLSMTPTDYEEVEASRVTSAWAAGANATHTVNQDHGVTVYDCEVWRRR